MKDSRYKQGSSKNCTTIGCMGNPDPKNLIDAEDFKGTICKICFCVHEYWEEDNLIIINDEKKSENEKEKKEIEYPFPKFTDEEKRKMNYEYAKRFKIKQKPGEQKKLFDL